MNQGSWHIGGQHSDGVGVRAGVAVFIIVHLKSWSGTVDPNLDADSDPYRYQNLIDCSLGHAPPLQKFHQNPFITFLRYLHRHTDRSKTYPQYAPWCIILIDEKLDGVLECVREINVETVLSNDAAAAADAAAAMVTMTTQNVCTPSSECLVRCLSVVF